MLRSVAYVAVVVLLNCLCELATMLMRFATCSHTISTSPFAAEVASSNGVC